MCGRAPLSECVVRNADGADSPPQFWDGRAATPEDQAKGPMANPIEMGNTHEALVGRLQQIPGYRPMFAESVRVGGDHDRSRGGGDRLFRADGAVWQALTAAQVRGMSVFFDKAKCDKCHEGANFTLNAYANIGVGSDKPDPDVGRFAVTKNPRDWGVFKTPTLREIAHTAPYMHDGSLKTLEEVVEFYDKGGIKNTNLDENIKPLHLTAREKSDLVEFLKSVSGEGWQNVNAPESFPQ
jgi:cytochrome c peroxidase